MAARVKEGRKFIPGEAHQEGRRAAVILERRIEDSRFTPTEIDAACGWSKGTLARSLRGLQPLTFSEVAAVAGVCSFDLRGFYMDLAKGGEPPAEEAPAEGKKEPAIPPALERQIRSVFGKLIAEMEKAQEKPKKKPKGDS